VGVPLFDEVVRTVLAEAPCRVMVIAAPQDLEEEHAGR